MLARNKTLTENVGAFVHKLDQSKPARGIKADNLLGIKHSEKEVKIFEELSSKTFSIVFITITLFIPILSMDVLPGII